MRSLLTTSGMWRHLRAVGWKRVLGGFFPLGPRMDRVSPEGVGAPWAPQGSEEETWKIVSSGSPASRS